MILRHGRRNLIDTMASLAMATSPTRIQTVLIDAPGTLTDPGLRLYKRAIDSCIATVRPGDTVPELPTSVWPVVDIGTRVKHQPARHSALQTFYDTYHDLLSTEPRDIKSDLALADIGSFANVILLSNMPWYIAQQQLGHPRDMVVCADDIGAMGSTGPEGSLVEEAMQKSGVTDPGRVALVSSTYPGLHQGRRAGTWVIASRHASPHQDTSEFMCVADRVIDNIDELVCCIDSLNW